MRVCTIVTWPVNPGFLWILIGITSPGFFFFVIFFFVPLVHQDLKPPFGFEDFWFTFSKLHRGHAFSVRSWSFIPKPPGWNGSTCSGEKRARRAGVPPVGLGWIFGCQEGWRRIFFSENCRSFKISRDTSRYQPWKIPSKNYGHIGKFRRFFRAKCCSNATR